MGYVVNKIVGGLLNPLCIPMIALLAGVALISRGRRRSGWTLALGGIAWLWTWSMPYFSIKAGASLEREWPPVAAEECQSADAIVLLGGGMASSGVGPYPEMFSASDRVWHAARLYRCGKAPIVLPSGIDSARAELPLLVDLGVPAEAVCCENESRNTEENARFTSELLAKRVQGARRPRVLLVTSALHMRRAKLMFERYAPGLDVIPAATDHENLVMESHRRTPADFFPSTEAITRSGYAFKEMLGYWGYRLLRR